MVGLVLPAAACLSIMPMQLAVSLKATFVVMEQRCQSHITRRNGAPGLSDCGCLERFRFLGTVVWIKLRSRRLTIFQRVFEPSARKFASRGKTHDGTASGRWPMRFRDCALIIVVIMVISNLRSEIEAGFAGSGSEAFEFLTCRACDVSRESLSIRQRLLCGRQVLVWPASQARFKCRALPYL